MKVYDGAGLIAEKSGAMVVPVRIEGLEATIFSRLSRAQVRRRWFPKVTLTMLEPVRLAVDDALKGKARRHAAGAALYQIMSDLDLPHDADRPHVLRGGRRSGAEHGWSRIALEDPVTGKLSYRKIADRRPRVGRQVHAACGRGRGGRRHAAQRQWRGRDVARHDVGGPRAGDDQFHRRRRQYPRRLHRRRGRERSSPRAPSSRGQARQAGRRARREVSASSISRICAATVSSADKIARR